jgi:hypothetical protein
MHTHLFRVAKPSWLGYQTVKVFDIVEAHRLL